MTPQEIEYYTQYIHEMRIRYIAIVDTAVQLNIPLKDIKEPLLIIGKRIEECRTKLGHTAI
jgi:hypothetical protein